MTLSLYRAGDVRFPFVWTSSTQPAGRWHGPGEGPCHYLATTPKGAWAEVLRHEGISTADDLAGLERALWEVDAGSVAEVAAAVAARLPDAVLTGDESTYERCRAEARRLRQDGAPGLAAPSAALVSGVAARTMLERSATIAVAVEPSRVVVLFPPVTLSAWPLAEGRCGPDVLEDVRQL